MSLALNAARGAGSVRSVDGPSTASGEPDIVFPRTIRKAFKAIASASQETTLVRVPWGPRLSVLFDPRGALGLVGGELRIYGVVESTLILLSRSPFVTAAPIRVLEEAACDTYLVAAILGTSVPPGATQVESYIYAGSYAGTV